MEDNGFHQRQQYSSASTASSNRAKYYFHILHYIAEDLDGGHYAMLDLNDDVQTCSSDCFLCVVYLLLLPINQCRRCTVSGVDGIFDRGAGDDAAKCE